MSRANTLSVGIYFKMLASNTESVKSLIAVMSSVSQGKQDAQISVAICLDSECFGGSTDRVLYDFLGVRCLVGYSRIGFAFAEEVHHKAFKWG